MLDLQKKKERAFLSPRRVEPLRVLLHVAVSQEGSLGLARVSRPLFAATVKACPGDPLM